MINRLLELRRLNGQTQKQASDLFNVSKSYYVQVELGTCKAGRGFIEQFKRIYPNESTDIFFEDEDAAV